VHEDRQVLICPNCQQARDWAAELDRCDVCGSVALLCRLGEVECRGCGHERTARRASADDLVTSGAPGLADEVAAALSRVLPRRPASPAP
jgi:hypothetical protein